MALANEILDFSETTRRSPGQHGQARTPAEREQLVRLYADLLERSYIGKIELYGGERIVFVGDTIERDQATVRTRLQTWSFTEKQEQGFEADREPAIRKASQAT